MTVSVWRRTVPLPSKKHIVAAVHFEHRSNFDNAPVECECGWSGIVVDFPYHGKDLGYCPKGHAMTADNRIIRSDTLRARCRTCLRDAQKASYARKAKAAA